MIAFFRFVALAILSGVAVAKVSTFEHGHAAFVILLAIYAAILAAVGIGTTRNGSGKG